MKKEQNNDSTTASLRANSAGTKSDDRGARLATAVCATIGKLLSGDGWTTAVTLDDAFAPELLQTWGLADDGENGDEADTRIVDLRDAAALT